MTHSFEDLSDLEPIPLDEDYSDSHGGRGDRALCLASRHGPTNTSSSSSLPLALKRRSSSSTSGISAMKKKLNSRKNNIGGQGTEVLVRPPADEIATISTSTTSTGNHPHHDPQHEDHSTGDDAQHRQVRI